MDKVKTGYLFAVGMYFLICSIECLINANRTVKYSIYCQIKELEA